MKTATIITSKMLDKLELTYKGRRGVAVIMLPSQKLKPPKSAGTNVRFQPHEPTQAVA